LCRAGAADIHAHRAEFAQRGVRLTVVTSQPAGIEEFKTAVWPTDEILVDEDETFKKALGGEKYKNRWLLSPAVIARIFKVKGFGSQFDDLNDKSTMLGGAMIVNGEGVIFAEAETSGFVYPSAAELLSALDSRAPTLSCTPSTTEATAS